MVQGAPGPCLAMPLAQEEVTSLSKLFVDVMPWWPAPACVHVPRASTAGTGSFLGIWSVCPALILPADFLPWVSGALLLRCEQIYLLCAPAESCPSLSLQELLPLLTL